MVHALETAHRLLAPAGRLVDIHPPDEHAEFQVQVGERLFHAGWMRETDDGVEYRHAERALAQVVEEGLFEIERETTFEFLHYAASLEEMRAHLAQTWSDALIEDEVARRIHDLMAGPDAGLRLRERVLIRRLKPVRDSA